jgi:hypothetical protein
MTIRKNPVEPSSAVFEEASLKTSPQQHTSQMLFPDNGLPARSVTERLVADLKPSPWKARKHSKTQIRTIAVNLKAFNFINPVLVDRYGQIVAGHGRVEAAIRQSAKSSRDHRHG